MYGCGIAFRCKSQITKTLELTLCAVLGHGTREVRLEWGTQVKHLVVDLLSPEFSFGWGNVVVSL